jgi:hypothetical protein
VSLVEAGPALSPAAGARRWLARILPLCSCGGIIMRTPFVPLFIVAIYILTKRMLSVEGRA